MNVDIRGTALFKEAGDLHRLLRGEGQVFDAADLDVSMQSQKVVFTASVSAGFEEGFQTKIGQIDLNTSELTLITSGTGSDRCPRFILSNNSIAFLSDRASTGDFQLYFVSEAGAVRAGPRLAGSIEKMRVSPDGRQLLLSEAAHGADVSSVQGAMITHMHSSDREDWMPLIEGSENDHKRRTLSIYDIDNDSMRTIDAAGLNIWEAAWCGNDALAAIASVGASEGDWYDAYLVKIDLESSAVSECHRPRDQLATIAANSTGDTLAFVEGLASDRASVAGDLKILDIHSGAVRPILTHGVDVTSLEWRSNSRLLVGGHRGFCTVVGIYDLQADRFELVWESDDISTAATDCRLAGIGEDADCLLLAESFFRSLEIGCLSNGKYETLHSFDLGYAAVARDLISKVEPHAWNAPDGLKIHGLLVTPRNRSAPYPLLLNIHGGPVSQWRNRRAGVPFLMLLRCGIAIFYPNPRGSTGWGQDFARGVVGDMGGADAKDIQSGLDYLLESGVADPERLYVTGGSYGGYMTAWLITHDDRFAAAVIVAPATNRVSQRLTCNIPQFVDKFLADEFDNMVGRHTSRSPIMYARNARTPTLSICGSVDRCTPPTEAQQFHNALRSFGTESVLMTYPNEGHGIRGFPAAIDYSARIVTWINAHPTRLRPQPAQG